MIEAADNTNTGMNGFPTTPPGQASPINVNMQTTGTGFSWGDAISNAWNATKSQAAAVLTATEDLAKDSYKAVKGEVGDIVGSVEKNAEGVLDFGISRTVLIVVAVAAGLYFIGKSGVVGQAMGK